MVQLDGRPRTVPVRKVFTHYGGDVPVVVEQVTSRETEVLTLVAEMYSTAEIAVVLYISVNTVKTHLKAAFRKLGVNTRRDAVRRARETGLLPDPLWISCPACQGTGRITRV